MLPGGSVGARACRYSGLNDKPPINVVASQLLTPTQITALTAAIEESKIVPPGEEFSCAGDDGSVDAISFTYPTGPIVRIIRQNGGCQFLENGVIAAFTDGAVTNQLNVIFSTAGPTH